MNCDRLHACLKTHCHYFYCIPNPVWRNNFFVTYPSPTLKIVLKQGAVYRARVS